MNAPTCSVVDFEVQLELAAAGDTCGSGSLGDCHSFFGRLVGIHAKHEDALLLHRNPDCFCKESADEADRPAAADSCAKDVAAICADDADCPDRLTELLAGAARNHYCHGGAAQVWTSILLGFQVLDYLYKVVRFAKDKIWDFDILLLPYGYQLPLDFAHLDRQQETRSKGSR